MSMTKRWILLGLLMPIVLSLSFVQAQSGCTQNLTEEECNLYETAWSNFLEGGNYNFGASFSIIVHHGMANSRYAFLDGRGFVILSADGEIDRFYYESTLLAEQSNQFDSDDRDIFNQFWQFGYQEGIALYDAEEGGWHPSAVETDDLPLSTFLPNLSEAFSFENGLTTATTFQGEDSIVYDFFLSSDYIADSPFATWHRVMAAQDLTDVSGTGHYSASVAINPDTELLQSIAFESFDYLDSESFGGIPLRLRVSYRIDLQKTDIEFGPFAESLDASLINSNSAFDVVSDYGALGLLSAALSEPFGELFTPIND
jgi:hypothetical protein